VSQLMDRLKIGSGVSSGGVGQDTTEDGVCGSSSIHRHRLWTPGRKPSLSGCVLAVLQSGVIVISLSIDGATFMTLIIEGALGVSSSQSLAVTESLELRDMTDEARPYTSSAIVPGGTGPGRAKMGKREFGVLLVGVLFTGVVGDVTIESAHRRLRFGEQRLLDADGESMPLWVGEGLNAIDQGERLDGSADGLNPSLGRLVSSTGEPVQEFREHIDKLAPGLR